MLTFKGTEPLFVGGTRYCFIHPEHPERCVKVLRPDRTGAARKAKIRNWKRFLPASSFDDQLKEIKAYRELVRQNNPRIWQGIPEYFGTVDTDLGLGIVTRLFRNHDGSWPLNLQQQLPHGMTPELAAGIEEFVAWVREEIVITRDLLPHNIIAVARQDGSYQVLIVDGIGNSELIPISTRFSFFGRQKVERKLVKFRYRTSILLPEADRRGVYACNS